MTVPANGALSASSIFIASSTPSTLALLDRVALGDATASTVPGIGAMQRAVAGGRAVAGEGVGPLEDEALAVEDDLDGVAGWR